MDIQDLDPVDNNNQQTWPEGTMKVQDVNDAGRADEGLMSRWHLDWNGSLTTTGTGSAYALSSTRTISAYYNGLTMVAAIHADSGAGATLNLNSISADPIQKNGGVALDEGDLPAGFVATFVHNGAGAWQVSSFKVDARTLGKFATSLPARLWEPNVTGGSGSEVKNQQANGVMYVSLPFGDAAVEAAQMAWQVPTSVDRTATISGRFLWTGVPAGGSYDVVWRVRAVAVGNGGAINATFGSYVSVTAPGSTNSYRIAAFAGLDPGSWSANSTLMLEVSRDPLDAADTLTGDAQFVGLEIEPTYNLPNDN